uniref:Sphingosine-1-phosphate phosphatase 1-like n=1 Tax=Gouania willdenowi TaxID=441366 RepID=A0A8C5DF33_GOUWI
MATVCIDTFVQMCRYLQDPRHVARFQKLCGVEGTFPKKGTEPDQDCPGLRRRVQPGGESSDTAVGNGAAGDFSAPQVNGLRPDGASESLDPVTRAKPLRRNSLTGDVGQEFLIHNKFLFYLFTFGTELGNEMFFIIFFPFLYWNIDALVSRRLIVVWAWNLFVGQSTKDMVRWSRPASPPVVKVEVFYNSEYSMPSTHAMTGTAIPFCLFMLTYGRWQEVITGFLYTLLILAFFQPLLDKIDTFYMTSPSAPLVIAVSHLSLGLVAFSLDSWSTSRGDTAQALGTGAGAALATHINYQVGLLQDPPLSSLPLVLPSIGAGIVLRSLLRFFIGVAVLLVTRMIMKGVTIPFLCRVLGLPLNDVRQARQQMRVELPYRYIVYSVVGFSCVCVVPLLFTMLNLA